MNLYQNHSDNELLVVLEHCGKLTYEAQLDLSQEAGQRNIAANTTILGEHLATTERDISDLVYLPDLGFQYAGDSASNQFEIKRTFKAQFMDVVSVVLGTVFFTIGLVYFWLLLSMFFGDNEFTMGKLVIYGLMILLGGIGFKMLSGIHRLLDFINFRLEKRGDTIQLSKHPKGKGLHFSSSDVSSELESDELILKVADLEIVRATATNLLQKMTLEELFRKLKTN